MHSKTKRVPKSKLKWLSDLSVRQLVYAAKALGIVHEGLEKAQLIEAIMKHKRVGRLRQCDVTEMRPTWDEVWAKIDWTEWEHSWPWAYRPGEPNALFCLANGDFLLSGFNRDVMLARARSDGPSWKAERDPTKSKKLYAKSLGYNWVHPWGR
jgi:hypothetical protein